MAGRFKGFCHFPCFQTLPPSRAPQARGEACVTVFERRSHLGPPAEGRQGPSDDDDDDYDEEEEDHYDFDDDDDDEEVFTRNPWKEITD